jgi:hypothetical protein
MYGWLLFLFPSAYREEYGDELQAVFNLSVDDALEDGWLKVADVVLHELVSLPTAILSEHLRERRRTKMTGKFASRFDFAPGSRTESFAALAPFVFGMVMLFFSYIGKSMTIPLWVQIAFVLLFWSSVLVMFLLGSAKGLPRWFLPYLGLPLPIAALLIFNAVLDPQWPGFNVPWLVGSIIMEGFLWSWMILIVVVFLLIAAWIPKFRPFYLRIRQDWTLLSFMLYGATPLALFITLDDYKDVEPFFFLSLLMLALGGWFYLRNDEPLKRFVSLHVGLALSMLTAAVGKAIQFEESWPQFVSLGWENEMIYTMVTWAWLALIMLLPLALNLLPIGTIFSGDVTHVCGAGFLPAIKLISNTVTSSKRTTPYAGRMPTASASLPRRRGSARIAVPDASVARAPAWTVSPFEALIARERIRG